MKAIAALIVFWIIFGMVYLLGAFICWELNPGNWDTVARIMVGFLGFFAAAWTAGMALI